jgi:predicted phage-related endonuclease
METTRRQITSIHDWLLWRRDFLCASEVAACVGFDPYTSPLGIYSAKAGMVSVTENGAMRRGRHFESAAIAYFAEEHPEYWISRPNTFIMAPAERLACTPDAVLEPKDGPRGTIVNMQIKTVSKPVFDKWGGVAPVGYTLQVACENMLMDAERGILAVLVVSNFDAELHTFDVPRHEAAERNIIEVAREFWENMEAGRFPPPDYRRDADVLAAMNPAAEPGTTVDLSNDNRLAEILPIRAKGEVKGALEELEALDAEIKEKIGSAETATLPGWRVTYKNQHRKAYTVAESTRRVLNINEVE